VSGRGLHKRVIRRVPIPANEIEGETVSICAILTTYLRKQLNANPDERKIREVRYHASHSDNLIQAADMLTGAVYTHFHRGNSEYLDYIRVKISDLWSWRSKTQ
jgi:hypothetical protein